jgi:NADPH-dependent 2,4-dienoyl-CoA reductase/sulfur reductase-like enzyme
MLGATNDPALLLAIYRSGAPDAPSTSPLLGDPTCDVVVIEGGFTGLSAALSLAKA